MTKQQEQREYVKAMSHQRMVLGKAMAKGKREEEEQKRLRDIAALPSWLQGDKSGLPMKPPGAK